MLFYSSMTSVHHDWSKSIAPPRLPPRLLTPLLVTDLARENPTSWCSDQTTAAVGCIVHCRCHSRHHSMVRVGKAVATRSSEGFCQKNYFGSPSPVPKQIPIFEYRSIFKLLVIILLAVWLRNTACLMVKIRDLTSHRSLANFVNKLFWNRDLFLFIAFWIAHIHFGAQTCRKRGDWD